MARRDPRSEIGDLSVVLAQLAAANDLFEHPGWKVYLRAIELAKQKCVDRLSSDPDADLRLEQRSIAMYNMLLSAMVPDRQRQEKLESRLRDLHSMAQQMEDAGLTTS